MYGAVRKQIDGVYRYAKQCFAEAEKEKKMVTTTDLLQERVAKSRDTQRMLSDAITKYAAAHPGATRADCIDKILYSPTVREMIENEHRLDELTKLGGGTLPEPGATSNIDFNTPVRGRTGYYSSVIVNNPRNQAAGENPIIRDHHQLLADIASGKVNETDPKFKALRELELERIFGLKD